MAVTTKLTAAATTTTTTPATPSDRNTFAEEIGKKKADEICFSLNYFIFCNLFGLKGFSLFTFVLFFPYARCFKFILKNIIIYSQAY